MSNSLSASTQSAEANIQDAGLEIAAHPQTNQHPAVKMTEKSYRFWDRLAKRYARTPVADETAYQKKLQITQQYLQPHMTVVEIGCGTGTTALHHADRVKHIYASDFSSAMIDIAKEKATQQQVDNVTFEQLSIDQLPYPDQSTDVVMGHSILHLVKDRDEAIARVYNMLKPGGVFVTSTACLGDRMKYFKFIAPVGRLLGLLPILRVFTAGELADSMSAAGFEIDYQWRPEKAIAVFIVARKPD